MGDLFCGDNSQGRFGNTADENPPQCDNSDSAGKGRKFGYYQGYNTRTRACNVVYPDQIKHEGFTHLVWAFASIHPTTFEIVADDEADHKWFNQFTQLRKFNVQTWISVGGWHFSNNKHTKWIWSAMVSSDENRAKFVKSVVPFLDKFGFQGLDLGKLRSKMSESAMLTNIQTGSGQVILTVAVNPVTRKTRSSWSRSFERLSAPSTA